MTDSHKHRETDRDKQTVKQGDKQTDRPVKTHIRSLLVKSRPHCPLLLGPNVKTLPRFVNMTQ